MPKGCSVLSTATTLSSHGSVGETLGVASRRRRRVAVAAESRSGETSGRPSPAAALRASPASNADPNLYYFGGADGGVWKTTNGGLTWPNVVAGRRSRRDRRDRDRSHGQRDGLGRHGRAEPAQRRLVRRRHLGDARRRRALAQRRSARKLGDRADRHRPEELQAPLGRGSRQSLSRQRAARRLSSPTTAAEPGGARSISGRPAARPTSRSIRAIRASSTPASGSFGAYRGALPAAARWTASSNRATAAATWRRLRGNGLPGGTMGRIGLAVAPSDPRRVYALIQSKEGVAVALRRRRRALALDDARHAGQPASVLYEPPRGRSVESAIASSSPPKISSRRATAARPTATFAERFIRITTVCGSRATEGASSKPTTAARRSRSTAARRGTGVSTSCSRRSTASATTSRIHTVSAAAFRTTIPTADPPTR